MKIKLLLIIIFSALALIVFGPWYSYKDAGDPESAQDKRIFVKLSDDELFLIMQHIRGPKLNSLFINSDLPLTSISNCVSQNYDSEKEIRCVTVYTIGGSTLIKFILVYDREAWRIESREKAIL